MNKNSHTDTSFPDEFLESIANSKQTFLSYAVKIEPVNFELLLEHFTKKSTDIFYFTQPDKKLIFLSFDELTVQTFQSGDFNKINNEIRILQSKLISNHDQFSNIVFPVFLTCAKFPTKKSAIEWKEFGEIDFLIPKISLFRYIDEYFLLYNELTETFASFENLNEIIEQHIEKIYQLESKLNKSESNNGAFTFIEESDNESSWNTKISELVEEIKQKKIDKIVISRRLKYNLKSELSWDNIFSELNQKYSNCTNFLLKSGDSIYFGSTPEMLGKFEHNTFHTEALAGSIKRGENTLEDLELANQLINSKKNNVEHDSVISYIKSTLQKFFEDVQIEDKPVVKKFSNIQHLHTKIKGTYKNHINIFDVILSLFPTPAVCGLPKDKALELIMKYEEFDRGLYSGLIGWFDCNSNGEFNVTIRSSLITKNNLFAYAGCGIVADSIPQEEFEETKLKFKPILSLFENAN